MAPKDSTAMDFYTLRDNSLFLTNVFKWYWLPKNGTQSDSVLVVSVTAREATFWVITYTILVTLIFKAVFNLATHAVLTLYRTQQSGNRHAILVSYYNSGGPSNALPLMYGYIWNTLWKCKKKGKWVIDRSGFKASFLLALLAFSLIAGDNITKFFLGGQSLIEQYIAQVNPAAVFYPTVEVTDLNAQNELPPALVDAIKGLQSVAVSQAVARQMNAQQNLQSRIQFRNFTTPSGTVLEDGSLQTEAGRRYEYQYHLTGYEMGLRDASGLVFAVRGTCETYYGADSVKNEGWNDTYTGRLEENDIYPFYGDEKWAAEVQLSRENFTAPWAFYHNSIEPEYLELSEKWGGYAFQIVPHTAWRVSHAPNPNPDPWYATEENLPYVGKKPNAYNAPWRIKNKRPPLRCTQNDTYTYNGQTVDHVKKLNKLTGLKLSPFIRDTVFGREFGTPVFSKMLSNLPFGVLASTDYFVPNQRRLDASRVSIDADFRRIIDISFVYSREVVRNTVLLYPSVRILRGNNSNFTNAAANSNGHVPEENADFLLESTEVAALSVFVMVTTPAVCAFLWLLVLIIRVKFSKLDNTTAKGRYGLRRHGLMATQLFRFLDEELSQERKWSGRNTDTPYIRDLDQVDEPKEADPPASAKPLPSTTTRITEVKADDRQVTEVKASATPGEAAGAGTDEVLSEQAEGGYAARSYAKPKLFPSSGPLEPPGYFEQFWNWMRRNILRKEDQQREAYDIAMTRTWDPNNPEPKARVPWKDICEGV